MAKTKYYREEDGWEAVEPNALHWSELLIANCFADCYPKTVRNYLYLRYYREEFYLYDPDQGVYGFLPLADIKERICRFLRWPPPELWWLKRCEDITPSLVNTILLNLQTTMGVFVPSRLSLPCWLITNPENIPEWASGPVAVMPNGILSFDEALAGESDPMHSWDHLYFNTTKLPYEYDREAACPKWFAFLQETFEEDGGRMALLQEWFGYCLTPDTSLHKFLLAVGPGANGKSVVFRVLTELLGKKSVSHVPLEMFGDRFALGDTVGKLANIVSEVGELDRLDEGHLKAYVSGDRITIDRKYKEPICVQPTARLMLATNTPPRVSDRSQGLWRRILYLPFEVTIPTERQNPRLAEELLAELPGIFNWALLGLARLRAQGRFTEPAACSRAVQEYRIDCDPVRAFLREYYEAAPGSAVATKDVYAHYTRWCSENGFHPMNSRNFGKSLRSVFPNVERRYGGASENRYWMYTGIRPLENLGI